MNDLCEKCQHWNGDSLDCLYKERLEDVVAFVENFTQIYVNASPASLEDAISYTLASMKLLKGIAVTHKGRENNE